MLKIHDRLEDVPEDLREHYGKRSDGKYEPQIENVNSVLGLLNKNVELLEKVKEIAPLKTRVAELEAQEVLPSGKVPIDKADFDALETYKALGNLDEIKPKVEGYDALRTEAETAKRRDLITRGLKAAGVKNTDPAFNLRQIDGLSLEPETKDGKEIFYAVTEDNGKRVKRAFDNEYLKEADGFKDILPSLMGGEGGEGHRHFKQSADGEKANESVSKTHSQRRYGWMTAANNKN